MKKKNILFLGITILCAVSVSACKPKYHPPVESPNETTAAADQAYEMDFTQLNNDVIDSYKGDDRFVFVRELDISGDNAAKTITLSVTTVDNVKTEAVDVFLTDVTRAIGSFAADQDFRLTQPDQEGFGSLYNIYSYNYIVKTESGQEIVNVKVNAGDSIPLDQTMDVDQMIENMK